MARRARKAIAVTSPIQAMGEPASAPENWLMRLAIVLAAFDRMDEAERMQAIRFIRTKYPTLLS